MIGLATANGAIAAGPAAVGIGTSLDEIEQVNNRRAMSYERSWPPPNTRSASFLSRLA